MVSFTFVVCAEPYKFEAIDTVINLGNAIVNKGHNILGIFLYGSGVYNIKNREITSDSMRNLTDRLSNFCTTNNTDLKACSTWVSFSGINPDEFIEGGVQEGLGGLSDLIARSDKVIFFGPGG
ncbi:MAG: DsrE/DsrF/TusD sulfur relay family protein [Promethearchaeota archaeon]|jgi:sulfur relay (sulfurtransferase) complex TusBCD TusD component (DsrE family)